MSPTTRPRSPSSMPALNVAQLAGRDALIAAAKSRVKEAEAQAAAARQKLLDLKPLSPVDAMVENTYFKVGEWVSAGQPVVSLQAPGDVTLRFYVPETSIAKATRGTEVTFTCDGCGGPHDAPSSPASSRPLNTRPPVIYSEQARSKLVYLVEAQITDPDTHSAPACPSKWSRSSDGARHRCQGPGQELRHTHRRRPCRSHARCRAASAASSVPTARARPRRCACSAAC